MSRSNKDQRARLERTMASNYIDAFNNSRSGNEADVAHFDRVKTKEEKLIRNEGPHDGRRFGNQRNMRSLQDKIERRADRKRHIDPADDWDGDLDLPSKPESPARRRHPKWS